ncbi:putative 50s ribosomal protein mrp49 [Diplodia seriata]|uniref:Putative 50s ribosomal protein mrp49 n=1 Tax=Diplodia seriata TaxID=420778 RepID=A0A0G2F1V1_9PEZI|nr:putative 50s ribosomal protein mrp49 [Diplodia seriata]
MPTIGQRMFKLKQTVRLRRYAYSKQLLGIRIGPGAAVMPKEVKKITMRLAPKIDDGHRGPKKFFKAILPRLQYRNPALRITVDRSAAQSDPAVMNILFDSPAAASAASTPSQSSGSVARKDRTVTIYMKGKTDSEILQQLYEVTGAKEVEPTEVEKEELRELAERGDRSRKDSERQAAVNRQRKREAELLAAARGQVGLEPS